MELDPGHLRVLSYNIHKGFGFANREFILNTIRDKLRSSGAQLCFLQEVCGEQSKHQEKIKDYPKESQFEYLADTVWPHFAYGKNAVYPEGHHGNAILSLYPIKSWDNIDLSMSRWERRGLLHTVIENPQRPPIHAFCLHLNLLENDRREQVVKIVNHIRSIVKDNEKIILAGDFNDWREWSTKFLRDELGLHEVYQSMHGRHAVSFPSFFPVMCLDRIYYRGLRPKSAELMNGSQWKGLSDHLAIQAEFDWPE